MLANNSQRLRNNVCQRQGHMMEKDKKASTDTETILMALDQISQTIDVMTSVVGRLRNHLQDQESTRRNDNSSAVVAAEGSSTVH